MDSQMGERERVSVCVCFLISDFSRDIEKSEKDFPWVTSRSVCSVLYHHFQQIYSDRLFGCAKTKSAPSCFHRIQTPFIHKIPLAFQVSN